MTKYILDPLNLDTNQPSVNSSPTSYDLKQMLINLINRSTSRFIPHGEYPMVYNNKVITLELTTDLLIRTRARSAQNRIEILEPAEMGKGSFGSIRESYGVLIPEKDFSFKKKSLETTRICKVLVCDDLEKKMAITHEAYYTKLNPLLHAKAAVISDNKGYLVMRKAQEQDLFTLIDTNAVLTIEKRLQISCMLIDAVIKQVHDLHMTHGDLKPENIMIDTMHSTATIIDYAFAREIGCPGEDEIHGTPEFIAPELLYNYQPTEKSDLYALGLAIGNLWGYIPQVMFNKNCSLDEIEAFHRNRKWAFLFREIPLSLEMQDKIRQLLDSMTAINPDERIMPKESLNQWQQLLADYSASQLRQTVMSNCEKESISLECSVSWEETKNWDNNKKFPFKLHRFFKPHESNTSNSQEEDIRDYGYSECATH